MSYATTPPASQHELAAPGDLTRPLKRRQS